MRETADSSRPCPSARLQLRCPAIPSMRYPPVLLFPWADRSPFEGAEPPEIGQGRHQDADEDGNLDVARPARLSQCHRPEEDEHGLKIEDDEEHGDEVEPDVEPDARRARGEDARFVGLAGGRLRVPLAEGVGDDKHARQHDEGSAQEDEERPELSGHLHSSPGYQRLWLTRLQEQYHEAICRVQHSASLDFEAIGCGPSPHRLGRRCSKATTGIQKGDDESLTAGLSHYTQVLPFPAGGRGNGDMVSESVRILMQALICVKNYGRTPDGAIAGRLRLFLKERAWLVARAGGCRERGETRSCASLLAAIGLEGESTPALTRRVRDAIGLIRLGQKLPPRAAVELCR